MCWLSSATMAAITIKLLPRLQVVALGTEFKAHSKRELWLQLSADSDADGEEFPITHTSPFLFVLRVARSLSATAIC